MKRFFTTIAITAALGCQAQTLPADSTRHLWTMEQCMAYAARHSSSVAQARWDVASATATKVQALADFFPSVSAQIGGQFSWGRNIDPETNTYNNVTTFNNGYGVYASITLFDGGQTINRYRQARSERERQLNAVEMRRDDCAIAAMMAYADAFYYLHSIRIAEDRLRQSKGMLMLTLAQEELGIKGGPDVAQAQATVAGDEYSLIHQRNLYDQALLALKSSMNHPIETELEIDTTYMSIPQNSTDDDTEGIFKIAMKTNPKSRDAECNLKSKQYSYSIAKGNMLPTLSLNTGISTSYYNILNGTYSVPGFGDQFRNNLGQYVAATLSIPIFSCLSRISSRNRARYAYEQAKEQFNEERRHLHDDIAAAVIDRDGYASEIRSLTAKVDADAEAYKLNVRKYEEGLLSLIDLQLSANSYFSSRIELLQKQMLFLLKDKLVEYYKGNRIWM